MKKLFITILFCLPFIASASLGDGLVHQWPMDFRDGSTATALKDRAGTLNLVNSGSPQIGNGLFGQAALTNTNNWYYTNSVTTVAPSNFTISAWILATSSIITNSDIWAYRTLSCGTHLPVVMYVANGSNITFQIENSSQSFAQVNVNNSVITLNKWHLLVGSYDGADMKLYLDGAQIGHQASALVVDQTAVSWYIGNSSCTGQSWFGAMDDVRIYNRALSATEEYNLYRFGIGRKNRGSFLDSIMGFMGSIL